MAGFPQEWVAELLSRCDIASIVSEYVELRPKGGRLWGLCPFHGEKTPSFSVTVDKQLYYCFGCHAGGNAIGFLMEVEKLSFIEAVKHLAQRANMSLPEEVDEETLARERAKRDRLYDANRKSAMFFYENLISGSGEIAREYLERRGVSIGVAKAFGIGYSPPKWDALLKYLTAEGFTQDEIAEAGLAVKKGDKVYDMFRGRLMFPIIGTYSRVIGFGARAMGEETPKYLNTNETAIFNKRLNLYALNMERGRPKYLTIVEGYMDVVGLYRNGIKGCVATLGTALTSQQAKLIKRYVNEVYIAYDGDSAGQNATERAIDILSGEGLNARAIIIPDAMDPDEYVAEHGALAFERLRENALSVPEFKLHAMEAQCNFDDDNSKAEFAKRASAYIATLSPLDQERYFALLARKTGFSSSVLRQEGQILAISGNSEHSDRNSLNKIRNTRNKDIQGISGTRLSAERALISLAAEDAALARKISQHIELFAVEAHRRFLAEMSAGEVLANVALSALEEEHAQQIARAISQPVPSDKEGACDEAAEVLRSIDINEQIASLQAEADSDDVSVARRIECVKRIKELRAALQ